MAADIKPGSHIATRDPVTGDTIDVAGDATTVWSSGARWRGVVAELHRFEGLDTPVFYVAEHVVALHRAESSWMEISGRERRCAHEMKRGNATLLPAGAPRQIRQGPSELMVISLRPELVEQALLAKGRRSHGLEERHVVADAQIVRIAAALEAEADVGFPSGALYGESMGTALAAYLVSRYASRHVRREHTGGLSPCRLRRVLSYIEENLAEDVRLDALARVAGLSQHRFAHNFKRAVGMPPHQFVIRRRIELAKPMLRDTEQTVASVTYALGFGSPSRFTYLFRRETGITPTRYRASFR